jgi:hypothetical protein
MSEYVQHFSSDYICLTFVSGETLRSTHSQPGHYLVLQIFIIFVISAIDILRFNTVRPMH